MLMSCSFWLGWALLYWITRLRVVWSRAGFLLAASPLSLRTVTLQAAHSPRSVMAVIVASPALRPVTRPSPSTVATAGLLLIQTMK